ncbi:MAG TPA: hypothetical protein VGD53_30215 [Actinoallomurus sp.]
MRKRVSRTLHRAPLVALALLMFGCGNPSSDSPTPPSTDAATPQSTPAVEGTGPERPAPAGEAPPPAIHIASLPVGGGADDDTATHQCVRVSWLGPRIPEGVSIVVTAVRIEPVGVFAQSPSGCGGPLCRVSFAFAASGDTCTVPVTAEGSPGSTARLYADGAVRCPQGSQAMCRAFAATAPRQSIELVVPEAPPPVDSSSSASAG